MEIVARLENIIVSLGLELVELGIFPALASAFPNAFSRWQIIREDSILYYVFTDGMY